MSASTPLFGLTVANVPIVNLRQEFQSYRRLLNDDAFRNQLEQHRTGVIYTDYGAYATREALLTHVVQRCVMGLESYLPFAVLHEGGLRKVLTREVFAKARDPFSLGAKSTAANYFHRLPALVAPESSLREHDAALYQTTLRFYREIRNPLFHGHEIQNDNRGDATHLVIEYIASLYAWIDGWCPPADLWKKTRDESPVSARCDPGDRKGRLKLSLRIPTVRQP
jgi:hypothetical protein